MVQVNANTAALHAACRRQCARSWQTYVLKFELRVAQPGLTGDWAESQVADLQYEGCIEELQASGFQQCASGWQRRWHCHNMQVIEHD